MKAKNLLFVLVFMSLLAPVGCAANQPPKGKVRIISDTPMEPGDAEPGDAEPQATEQWSDEPTDGQVEDSAEDLDLAEELGSDALLTEPLEHGEGGTRESLQRAIRWAREGG